MEQIGSIYSIGKKFLDLINDNKRKNELLENIVEKIQLLQKTIWKFNQIDINQDIIGHLQQTEKKLDKQYKKAEPIINRQCQCVQFLYSSNDKKILEEIENDIESQCDTLLVILNLKNSQQLDEIFQKVNRIEQKVDNINQNIIKNNGNQNNQKQRLLSQNITQTSKLLLVGQSGVGKSSIIHQYKDKEFPRNIHSTIGTDFCKKIIYKNDQKNILIIWDTAGQERFRSCQEQNYRNTDVALVVFSYQDIESISQCLYYINSLRDKSDCKIYLIGNKTDLATKEDFEISQKFAEEQNLELFNVSAKTNRNIDYAFETIIDKNILVKNPFIKLSITQQEKRKQNCLC